jgi:hypothetical protein
MKSRRERRRLLIKKPPNIRIERTDHRVVILIFKGDKSKREQSAVLDGRRSPEASGVPDELRKLYSAPLPPSSAAFQI